MVMQIKLVVVVVVQIKDYNVITIGSLNVSNDLATTVKEEKPSRLAAL